jgi:uncharacterized protein (TIGR02598 family)
MKTNLYSPGARNSGFSLVEIVVAVGIVATVMVALLGMIPTGLNTVNEAADKMAEIRIAQQLLGEVQMTAWDDVDEWEQGLHYFDGEGNRLTLGEKPKVVYTAKVEVDEEEHVLPRLKPEYDFVHRVVVKIARKRGGGSINFGEDAEKKEYTSFSSLTVMTESAQQAKGF